jgi:hypothetical protein
MEGTRFGGIQKAYAAVGPLPIITSKAKAKRLNSNLISCSILSLAPLIA